MISAHVVNLSAASGFVGNVSRAALRNAVTAFAGLSRAATSASDTRANSEGLNSASALRRAVMESMVIGATIQCRAPPDTGWTGRCASRYFSVLWCHVETFWPNSDDHASTANRATTRYDRVRSKTARCECPVSGISPSRLQIHRTARSAATPFFRAVGPVTRTHLPT